MDEFTYDCEGLDMRVSGLSIGCLVQSYVSRIKLHISNEVNLHDITNMEDAICKAKATKNKFERKSLFYKIIHDLNKEIVGFLETNGH